MSQLFNIYCDESCHLQAPIITPSNRFMVLGGVACPDSSKDAVFRRIKELKKERGLTNLSEMKWTKTSKGKLEAYRDLLHYFFDCNDLSFRAVVIDKEQLRHDDFGQTHDQFYYKMYWQLLEWFIEPSHHYHIYLDIKDTQGVGKVNKLHEVLCNSRHDFDRAVVKRIQEVHSHEIALMQLTDILIGAISFANRYPDGGASPPKNELVNLLKSLSGMSLQRSTSLGARKFNILRWEGQR